MLTKTTNLERNVTKISAKQPGWFKAKIGTFVGTSEEGEIYVEIDGEVEKFLPGDCDLI